MIWDGSLREIGYPVGMCVGIVFTELTKVETHPCADGTVLQTGPSTR